MRILLISCIAITLGACSTGGGYNSPVNNQNYQTGPVYSSRQAPSQSSLLPPGYYFDQDGIIRDSAGEVKLRETCKYYGSGSDECFLAGKRETETAAKYLNEKREDAYVRWRRYCEPRGTCGEDAKRKFDEWVDRIRKRN